MAGPEARIFSALGATAVGFDPYLYRLPYLSGFPANLTEESQYLNQDLSQKYGGAFDLTLSSWVFDQGSGLAGGSLNLMEQILLMTKPGSISLHNGSLMPALVEQLASQLKVLKIVSSFGDNFANLGKSPNFWYVLQKN